MRRLLGFICLALMMLTAPAVSAEADIPLCINEICSKNGGSFVLEGMAPDYIELRNRTEMNLPLDSFFLSDDENRLNRFSLAGYEIPKGSYLILCADKKELPFKLSATDGEELFLSDGDGNILQHVTFPPLEQDKTYSLQEDGQWHITAPTPLEPNASGMPYIRDVHAAAPEFSHQAGFYEEPFDLILTCSQPNQIYYTTDGSIPNENALLYTGPIRVEDLSAQPNRLSARTDITVEDAVPPAGPVRKATVIRAVAIDQDGNRSPEAENTYFVGYGGAEAYKNIPVLSIIAAPESLFDEKDGIYVRGKVYEDWIADGTHDTTVPVQQIPTNYRMKGQAWEIPVTVQWFDAKSKLRMSQGAGLRIHGNWSRERAKKSFNLYARKDYGEQFFTYNILPERSVKERLVLRGNLGKDVLLHAMLAETGIPTSPGIPCMAFVNGEFWGFYEMREKQDERDIAAFYGLDKDDLVVIKNGELIAGELPRESSATDGYSYYRSLPSEIAALNPATDDGYRACGEIIDLENYIDYTAAIAYLNDSDYGSNYTIWRIGDEVNGPGKYTKWHWIFQDLDNCCFTHSGATEMISLLPDDRLFAQLWQNESFRTAFLTRIMDYANVELTSDYVMDFITPVLTAYAPYLKENSIRYPNKEGETGEQSQAEIKALGDFFASRREKTVSALKEWLGAPGETGTLTLPDLPGGMMLQVNKHQAYISGDRWSGVYFAGSPVTFQAEELPGYRFTGWYEGEKLLTADAVLEITVQGDRTIRPVYEQVPTVVAMNRQSPVTQAGPSAFRMRMEKSGKYCMVTADTSVRANLIQDNAITCITDPSQAQWQGLTLSLPLYGFTGAEGSFTLEADAGHSWRVLCGNDETAPWEQSADVRILPDGKVQVNYFIPEELVNAERVDIRLETEPAEENGSFTLRGFGIYGTPVHATLLEAREYIRLAHKIKAPEAFIPDLEALEGMPAERIVETVSVLRRSLQETLAREAVATAEAVGSDDPALEGLQDCPAVTVTQNLIDAFYNEADISVPVAAEGTVYLYEWTNGRLVAQGQTVGADGQVTVPKHPGTFLLLNQVAEDVRFHVAFSEDPIPPQLLDSAMYGIKPRNTLWMEVKTITAYQEEAAVQLPVDWAARWIYVYRLEDDALIYVAEKQSLQDVLRLLPQTGTYLLMDEKLESLSERAEQERRMAEGIRREVIEREEKTAKTKRVLAGVGTVLLLTAGIAVLTVLIRQRKRPF